MTLAVDGSSPIQHAVPPAVPVVILGTDALLAALPATSVQLAHACVAAGFVNVVPASWGDELIAAAVLRRLPQFGDGPAIQCSCPIVAHRLLTVGGDLRPVLLAFVPPPVAVARYVRMLAQPTRARITYVGSCPGAVDDSIDIRMTPASLLELLSERHISLIDQPRVFESVIPPDRRRFRSQPGGVPSADALWSEFGGRTLSELDGDDLVVEVAQLLLAGKNVLIDPSVRLGCVCSGAAAGVPAADSRPRVLAIEPPRATTPVVEERAAIDLQLHLPALSRSPIDVMAVPAGCTSAQLPASVPPAEPALGRRASPVRGVVTLVDPRISRPSGPVSARPLVGTVPHSRDVDGRSLPRAYVARRRSSPKGIRAVSTQSASGVRAMPDRPQSIPWSIRPRHVLYLAAAAIAVVIILSATVGLVVGRSLSVHAVPVSHQP
jgi:hypothetical protein